MEKTYTLYILLCGTGEYYTGITVSLDNRLLTHQMKDRWSSYNSNRWTKDRQPVELVFKYERIEYKLVALQIERYIKTWKHQWKKNLVDGDEFALNLLKSCHQKKLEEYLSKSNTSSRVSQIPHPYTAHTQKLK
jgi:predicted GIY-YIG superfamily endonuclease